MTANSATMSSVRIRTMREEDLDQVKEIDRMSFTIPWPDRSYEYEFYKNPLSLLLVAESEEQDSNHHIVGTLVVWLIIDEAHIATIVVHPEYRNQGIAKKMLAEALKIALQKGMRQATLEVRANNFIAHKLYEQFGFEIVGRRDRYYRDNYEDALIMTIRDLDKEYIEWMGSILSDWTS